MAKNQRADTGASFDDLATAFRHGRFAPLYFFFGDEGFLMDELQALAVQHAVAPHERDFNLDIVFGPEAEATAVLAQCAQYPMMAERRLIVVRGFESLDGNDAFKGYAEHPNPTATVLLLCHGKPNLSQHPYRALKQHATWAEFRTLKPPQAAGWAERRLRGLGLDVENGVGATLVELAGADLQTLASEAEKLAAYVGTRGRLTRDDVLTATGHSADTNPFALQDALAAGDAARALAIADALLATAGNRAGEAIKLVGLLTAYVLRLWKLTGCLNDGTPEPQLSRQIGVPPFVVPDYVRAARRWGPTGLRRAMEALLAADTELKGGSRRDERTILALALPRVAAPRRAVAA